MPSVVEPSLLLRFAGAFFVCAALALGAAPARAVDEPATAADSAQAAPLAERVQQFAQQAARAGAPDVRVQVDLGALDTRLKLAPCARISPYLPSGTKLWGASRIGVRCDEGARWNVYLPVRVKVYAQAVVLRQPLAAGTVIEPAHLAQAEVDLAAEPAPVLRREADVLGRASRGRWPAGPPCARATCGRASGSPPVTWCASSRAAPAMPWCPKGRRSRRASKARPAACAPRAGASSPAARAARASWS